MDRKLTHFSHRGSPAPAKKSATPKDLTQKVVWSGSTQLAPVPVVLVGCGNGEDLPYNLLTVAWTGIVCSSPPIISISIRPERNSFQLIKTTGEFTVNLPPARLASTVDWCGVISGKDHDKFKERNLTPLAGSKVTAPLVAECPLGMECQVQQTIPLGSHTLFLAKILAVQVAKTLLDSAGRLRLEEAGLLAYAHGHYFELGRCLGHFGYSVRKKPGPNIRS